MGCIRTDRAPRDKLDAERDVGALVGGMTGERRHEQSSGCYGSERGWEDELGDTFSSSPIVCETNTFETVFLLQFNAFLLGF